MANKIDPTRITLLTKKEYTDGPLIYWMTREHRVNDNWSLVYTQEMAAAYDVPYGVLYTVHPSFFTQTKRHADFLLQGLQEVEKNLAKKNIPFFLLSTDKESSIASFFKKQDVGMVITDFFPLKPITSVIKKVIKAYPVPLHEVDAHNVVPCRVTSPKQEYAARTIRPKIHKQLNNYLQPYPTIKKQSLSWPTKVAKTTWSKATNHCSLADVAPITWVKPGEAAAHRHAVNFITKKIKIYKKERNDPTVDALSNLSPYLHFGHINAQTVLLLLKKHHISRVVSDAFIEELIVRKELSDNYCHYNDHYDSPTGFPDWATKTLTKHLKDKRTYSYTRKTFEQANTHDHLWNAAQRQMMITGKMHGFMRMYWAKKILEWSNNFKTAFKTALYLNDTYSIDGYDPNGYVGVAWSIGGVHDRPWKERPIFGMIRYMSYDGCKRKFKVEEFEKNWE